MKLWKYTHVLPTIVLALTLSATTINAAPGDLDASFDPGPVLWQGFAFPAFKYAIVMQTDGKVIIGGQFDTVAGTQRIFVARLNSNGSLDNTFNTPLQTIPSQFGPGGEVYDLLLQPDGKIIVSGYFRVGGVYNTVVRLNSDGTLDGTFNVTTNGGSTNDNHIYRTLLQPDGKIIIASNALDSVNGVTTNRIARLTSTGALDAPLGVTGNILFAIFALALQPDGKIVIGGGSGSGGMVVRINSDGSPDPGFTIPDIGLVSVDSLAIETDGQILVGARGRLTVNGNLTDGLIRLNPNGSFDLSFNPPDIRTAWTLYVQADGKIAVGGTFTVNFGLARSTFGRINPDGSLDFINDGGGPDNDLQDMVRQPDGKYIVVGTFENFYQGKTVAPRTGVARILEAPATPPAGKIAFDSNRDGNREIYVMNADGTEQTRLTSNTIIDSDPSLSTDGRKIVFLSRDPDVGTGFAGIFIMNADGTNRTRLTNQEAYDEEPSINANASRIVFSSRRDGNYEIYIMNADGTNPTRLTNNAIDDGVPSFNSDGSKIVFRSFPVGNINGEIYTMNADGTNQTRLTFDAARDEDPTFAPDGRIVFRSNRDGNLEIYRMNADGTNLTRLTNNATDDYIPSVSPDGSRIAFVRFFDLDGTTEIFTMNADGSNETRLTNNSAVDINPSWGGTFTPPPASGRIVFDARPTPTTLQIFSMNPDGTNRTPLTTSGADYDPSVSADGSKIAFVSSRDDQVFEEIFIMNADGSGQMRLTNNNEVDLEPAISPDGTKIAFASLRDGNWEIYSMNSDGSGTPARLTTNTFRDDQPAFNPDGSKIVFRSNREGASEIYVMDANGGNPTRLTTDNANSREPVFSPDGTKIAFRTARDGNFEIYAMNANGTNPVRLTNNAAIDSNPTYSPDGWWIAFASERDGNSEIYVMNSDGTNTARLTNNAIEDNRPSWGGTSGPPAPTPVKLKIGGGNVFVGSPGQGLILRSPNGTTCVKIGIDNAGAMTTVVTPCP